MEKINKTSGGMKMHQKSGDFIESLVAVDFNNRSEESEYK